MFLLALAVSALAAAATAAITGATNDYCQQLHLKYANMNGVAQTEGAMLPVSVWWDGSAPSRAAAALLLAAASHGLRYRGLRMRRADALQHILSNKHHLLMAPAFAARCDSEFWRRVRGARWLRVAGAGAAPPPSRAPLLLRAAPAPARAPPPPCTRPLRSTQLYDNTSNLQLCLLYRDADQVDDPELVTYSQYKWYNIELEESVSTKSHLDILPLAPDAKSRRRLLNTLHTNASFLFYDYDMWEGVPGVFPIRSSTASCNISSELSCSFRFITTALQRIAPPLNNVMRRFMPLYSDIREILEIEAHNFNITEAACEWALTNYNKFESWFREDLTPVYRVIVFLCDNDFHSEYRNAIRIITQIIKERITTLNLEVWKYNIKCDDEFDSMRVLEQIKQSYEWARTIGALGAGAGVQATAAAAAAAELALVWYDIAPPAATLSHARLLVGPPASLLTALKRLLRDCRWRRLGVVSEDSHLADAFISNLMLRQDFPLHNIQLKEISIEYSLKELRRVNARIVFINTNAKIGMSILCEAFRHNMTRASGFVWILREWYGVITPTATARDCIDKMIHYTVSFWWRGGDTILKGAKSTDWEMRRALDALWPRQTWPRLAASLADGLILLLNSFNAFIEKHPLRQYNLHARGTTRLIWDSLEKSVPGILQYIYAKNDPPAEPLIFVDEWRGTERLQVAVCNATGCIYNQMHSTCFSDISSDGSRFCLTNNSQYEFEQHCNDVLWSIAASISTLTLIWICIARRVRMKRIKCRDHQSIAQLLAPGQRAAAKLADHLVDRAALEIRQELGSGRFGRVQFAILRTPNRPTQAVAVKSLRDDASAAEETEFLGEAYTLASIKHCNIVRLIGVCATGGPPLLLMEHVFFGDLLRYLRERRHLVEHMYDKIPEEATYVSPYALTKLAREASLALAYLTKRRIVHRDVRASNCLVDARRSLKLADFGMAREALGNDGAAEYACRRRGFFPALWMAPESLDQGVFSPATDVWGLGVLMFEMVTLGERPYGAWSPLRVLRYVIAGGRPPLPSDASLKTRGVLLSCWRRKAEERPTAADTAAYLDANPLALSPALHIAPLPPESFNYFNTTFN